MTAIFDVAVNTDDLVVLASPSVIDVSVDFGPQGQRGATFYAGSGNPNESSVLPTTIVPISGDIYINVAAGANYGWLFIYNPKTTGNNWDQVLRLNPPIYSRNIEKTFTDGSTTITIPVSEIVPPGVAISSASRFIVNITPVKSVSTVLTITGKTLTDSNSNLNIVISGIKYSGGSGGSWSNLNAELVDIATSISVV